MSDLIKPFNLFYPFDPSPVEVVDIEYLLDESEQISYNKLVDAGFTTREIKICVRKKPKSQYLSYAAQENGLLFDYNYKFEIAILQHVHNIRQWLKEESTPADEWLSHGYALAWLHHHSTAPDRYKKTISLLQTERAKAPRSRNPLLDEVIRLFRAQHEPPANSDIKCFGKFIGKGRVFDDLNIEVIEARNTGKRIIYKFKRPGSKRTAYSSTREGISKKLKTLAKIDLRK